MNIFVTGHAGFIGYHLVKALLKETIIKKIYCVDNYNAYYDVKLKKNRFKNLKSQDTANKIFEYKFDISNLKKLINIFKKKKIDIVINLASQAGVRYSFENPKSYIDSNIVGFFNILELIKLKKIKKLIYASSSSVYGEQNTTPFFENKMNNTPLQLYAATKISNEVMAYSYSHLFNFSAIGLRFFSVYGPWGRPDMAIYKFTKLIYENKPIKIFGNGKILRDYTYIDDVIDGIIKIIKKNKIKNTSLKNKKFSIFNLGFGRPVSNFKIISQIERNTKKKVKKILVKKNKIEMSKTYSSNKNFYKEFKIKPKVSISEGLKKFNDWFLKYHKINKTFKNNSL
jgi:UDP-glucuronate 4-epimerase